MVSISVAIAILGGTVVINVWFVSGVKGVSSAAVAAKVLIGYRALVGTLLR